MKKNDIILICIILSLAALTAGYQIMNGKKETAGMLEVYQEKQLIAEYSLSEDGVFTIHNEDGGTNILEIKEGRARMKEADCPDHICVRQGWISHDSQAVTCLPHKLVLVIKSKSKSGLDAVVQ